MTSKFFSKCSKSARDLRAKKARLEVKLANVESALHSLEGLEDKEDLFHELVSSAPSIRILVSRVEALGRALRGPTAIDDLFGSRLDRTTEQDKIARALEDLVHPGDVFYLDEIDSILENLL